MTLRVLKLYVNLEKTIVAYAIKDGVFKIKFKKFSHEITSSPMRQKLPSTLSKTRVKYLPRLFLQFGHFLQKLLTTCNFLQ